MDMQDKLIVFHKFSKETKQYDIEKIKSGDIIFKFNEYEPISIKIVSEKYEIFIECVNYRMDNEYFIADNNLLKLENGKSYDISDNNINEDLSYIPAKYCVYIQENNDEKIAFFEVTKNKNLSEEGLDNIVEKLNKFINGLSIDFFKSKKINNIIYEGDISDYAIFELLSVNKNKIIMHTNNIISKFIRNIQSEYVRGKVEKKQNQYTIKRNCIAKYNNNIYNIKKSISNNNIENTLLKMYLKKIRKLIEDIDLNVQRIQIENSIKLDNVKIRINSNYETIKNSRLSVFDKNFIKNENKSLIQERKYYDEWKKKLEDWNSSYKVSKNYITKLMNTEELVNVTAYPEAMYSVSFELNKDYAFFKKLYIELVKKYDNKHKKNEQSLFNDKKTFSLFELYGFILIQNILKELGFTYIEQEKNVFSFYSNSEFIYIKDNIKIKVQYDHFCHSYFNENAVVGEIVSVNSKNCKPDYIISIYDIDDNLKKALIVEMKYRYLRYLCDKKGRTETDNTLDDYWQLGVKIKEHPNYKSSVISDVMVVYPEMEEKCFLHNSGYYIGINSDSDFDKSLGYNMLKERIMKQINTCIL